VPALTVSATDALNDLLEANQKFAEAASRPPDKDASRRKELLSVSIRPRSFAPVFEAAPTRTAHLRFTILRALSQSLTSMISAFARRRRRDRWPLAVS
jgi:hypothetical protein